MTAQPSSSSTETPRSSERRLPPLLRRAWYGLNQAFRQRIAHLAITPDQYSILRWLHEGDAEGMTQREIADVMASDPNTVTSLLTRMEKAGLIMRKKHERDGRAHRIVLRALGEQKYSDSQRIAHALQQEIMTVLPESRLVSFLEDLERVAGACQTSSKQRKLARNGTPLPPA